MWVFGYGSLIWKADFPYKQKLIGYIRGYKRRFYQHSVDHRGRPSNPGRVVTLVPGTQLDSVWGVAYEIFPDDVEYVTKHLDYREKTGYQKQTVMFYPVRMARRSEDLCIHVNSNSSLVNATISPFQLTIYIGSEDNQWYAGPAEIDVIARQILKSEGPSGTNREYLYKLAEAMRRIAPEVNDEHLFQLEETVRHLETKNSALSLEEMEK